MANKNAPTQIAELKSLMKEFKGEGVFTFLGPKPAEATDANPTRLKIVREVKGGSGEAVPVTVLITMPIGYPADAAPIFAVEESSLVSDIQIEALEDLMKQQASYMPGMECISTSVQSLDGLQLSELDVGSPGRCRSIFKVDLVNNSPVFTKNLKSICNGLPCIWYYRTIGVQNNAKFSFAVDPLRAVYVLVDAPDKKGAVEFMKSIRTTGDVDMDMLGKPTKIQLTVVEEFELAARAEGLPEGFSSEEYRTDEDLDGLMNGFLAANAGIKQKK
eukprot:TRINITY_DN49918_c0_g1_i1.p1 TRINITY_DN49918_c0_g1~~TRINITY_DN49918_c0_g1_i1.p1  ORF type:complete len:274 (-),score=21.26 TRINITY_DN49918_c0_g1_i1:59-880(-)